MKRVYTSLLLCWLIPFHAADSAEFFGLGDFVPPTEFGFSYSLSGDGETVFGGFFDNWYWTRETGWQHPLETQPPQDPKTAFSFAGLSRNGIAAGSMSTPIGSRNHTEPMAVRWHQDDGIVLLGYLPGHDHSWASAISHDGNTILGWSRQSDDRQSEKTFLWNAESGIQPIPELDGTHFFTSDAMGRFYGRSATQVVEWTPQTGVQNLDAPRSFMDVSADGSTFLGIGDSPWQQHFLLWNRASGTIDSEELVPESWQYSFATGVSADGSRIVGWGGELEPEYQETAYLYTPAHGVSMLEQQIDWLSTAIPELARWELNSANDISDDGKVIIGTGLNPDGKQELWMLSLRGGVSGDFDMSGTLTAIDVDMLSKALLSEVWLGFDVDQDGHLNADDVDFWVHELANTWYGDANVDGEFNSSDLVSVFRAGHYEDAVDGNSGWAEGDWNADADFTSADLVLAFRDAGYERGPRQPVVAVPEPSETFLWFALLGPGSLLTNRRRTL